MAIPLVVSGKAVAVISIRRAEVREFTDRQIELLKIIADQAVIASENTRLFEEVQARTRELTEALEQQTATSEVLKVISSSPGELEPVFQIILENAVRICDAQFGTLFRYDGKLLHRAAGVGTPPALVEFQKQRGPRCGKGSIFQMEIPTRAEFWKRAPSEQPHRCRRGLGRPAACTAHT